jgi:carboxypeptidase C (cathepsin A)
MFGLFIENGPLRVIRNGTTMDDFQIIAAERAWTDNYNVLYIDQPANVGFSWGTSYVDNETDASTEFISFLEKFFKMYTELAALPVYLTGESYAGKYLPLYTHDIIEYNKLNADTKINVRGTLIGDPYSSPVLQRTQIHRVPEALGILDDMNLDQIALLEQKCLEQQAINLTKTADVCGAIMGYVETISDNVLPYDSRIFDYDFSPKEQVVKDIFTVSG